MKLNTLIIDDEKDACEILSELLERLGHNVIAALDGQLGLNLFRSRDFDLIITDIRMPGIDGIDLLKQIKQVEQSPVDIIVVTGHGDMDNAIKALKFGAYDYLLKPIDVRELAISIERLCKFITLQSNYRNLKSKFNETVALETKNVRRHAARIHAAYMEEIGLDSLRVYSQSMREVLDQAEKYSQDRQVPVLIQGESGTGKELIAKFIHHFSESGGLTPFVAINCGAISRELFESELFGYESGSFTGANSRGREGKLEAARGGTVFLDEIGEMPFDFQVKLLRALDDGKIFRIGGVKEISLDIRIISATNKELDLEVERTRFRLDLFYRINTGTIRILPLRDRKEDILPLAGYFVQRAFARRGIRFPGFTPEADNFMFSYAWPGNVRQLKNAMCRIALMPSLGKITAADLKFINEPNTDDCRLAAPHILEKDTFILPEKGLDLQDFENTLVRMALVKNEYNKSKTAEYLGISRKALYNRLKKIR